MRVLKLQRALTVMAALAPLVTLTVVTAAPAQAESGNRICAKWSTKDGKTVYRAIKMPKDYKKGLCEQHGANRALESTLTNAQPSGWPWWDTCEEFADKIGRSGQDPCVGMPTYTSLSKDMEKYVREF